MPKFYYKCDGCCHEVNDVNQKINDAPLTQCPFCKEDKLYRVIKKSISNFKGDGFHCNDYGTQV